MLVTWKPQENSAHSMSGEHQARCLRCFINPYPTFFFFGPHHSACRILIPRPGTEPGATAVKAPSPNHWTARERLNPLLSR